MPKPVIQDFLSALSAGIANGTFVRLVLSGYKGSDESLKKIIVRAVQIKRAPHLSFTYQHKTRDITKNFPIDGGLHAVSNALGNGFTAATLFTTGFDLTWPSLKKNKATYSEAPSQDHDRTKKRDVKASGQPWLHALGITGADGKVLATGQDKYRQINKFIELIGPLFADIKMPRVVDMGSGKGYLTFALYDYLRNQNKTAQVTGVEDRAELVRLCNDVAFASDFDGLHFEQGRIADFKATDIDVLIALHACDTATDDAIAAGLKAGAQAIVVAPCCHKQIRREMEKSKHEGDLSFLMRHGTFMERQAEMVTDALRALYLEVHGYQVKVFEFISDAHTPKNVMIIATRGKTPQSSRNAARARIDDAKKYFGIARHPLDSLL